MKGEKEVREYIEIPLDTYQYIENLISVQAGAVLKNIYAYFFGNVEPDFEGTDSETGSNVILDATVKTIKRIKEYEENGE